MNRPDSVGDAKHPRIAVVAFGIALAACVVYVLMFVTVNHAANDFYRESWGPYRRLFHDDVIGFLRTAPGYVGSLVLRAPFALLAALFGADARTTYVVTALPCVIAPAFLAGWLAPERPERRPAGARRQRRIWPLDLFMLTPPAVICVLEGHPEDILGAVLCVAAVLLAQRGSTRAAGVMLGLALINKSWALVAAPLVFAVMPTGRRLEGFGTAVIVTAVVMVPLLAIRMEGPNGTVASLGSPSGGVFVIPQMLWFVGPHSWVAREGHILLVLVAWIVTAAWWWLRVRGASARPSTGTALTMLALLFFLRAALDPWDNGYYFVPFMLAIMTYEDDLGGFPKLSWSFAIMLVIFVPPAGVLRGLGNNGHAAVFAVWALAAIAFFGRRAFAAERPRARRLYAAVSRSSA